MGTIGVAVGGLGVEVGTLVGVGRLVGAGVAVGQILRANLIGGFGKNLKIGEKFSGGGLGGVGGGGGIVEETTNADPATSKTKITMNILELVTSINTTLSWNIIQNKLIKK